MRYIAQQQPYGCAVAALAMVTDQEYNYVLRCFEPFIHMNEGLQESHIAEFLYQHGHAWQTIYRHYQWGFPNRERRLWPPQPWAPRHLIMVTALHGWHIIAMDAAGNIGDPDQRSRKTIDHPAYKEVHWVMGCWRVKRAV